MLSIIGENKSIKIIGQSLTCCRKTDEIFNNPVYINSTKATIKDATLKEEHVYDAITYDDMDKKQEREPKNKLHPNDYQNFARSTYKNTDCATIKSDQPPPDKTKKEKTHREKPKPPSKPNYANVPTVTPVAKARQHIPVTKNLSLEDEYILPDIQHTTGDQYISLDKTGRAENNQYTSLLQQSTALVSQPPPPPSKYTVPRRLPANN